VQKFLLLKKMENREIKQIVPGAWFHCKEGGYKERV
jgi:hypothetical protein